MVFAYIFPDRIIVRTVLLKRKLFICRNTSDHIYDHKLNMQCQKQRLIQIG